MSFSAERDPGLALEFRSGRLNVAWSEYPDLPADRAAINRENRARAREVLAVVLGPLIAERVVEISAAGRAGEIRADGVTINITAMGPVSNLVTVRSGRAISR